MDKAGKNGDVIRRVSKGTAFLQGFAVLLLLCLIYLLSGVYGKYQELQDGIRENALWSVYQLDRETRRLNEVGSEMLARQDVSGEAAKKLSTRYDILYSRMALLKKANLDLRLGETPGLYQLVAAIEPAVMSKAPIFDAIAAGQSPDLIVLAEFLSDMKQVMKNTEELLTNTNNKVSSERADAREALQSLQVKTGAVTFVLALSVGVLVVSLRRQLRSVRAAGLEFEDMARELKESFAAAEAGNRAKSQFMATMGHEVRTPLNAILGTAELLELSELPDRVRTGVQTISRSGQSLLEILNEILDFAKMENGQIDVKIGPTDVAALVSDTVEMLRDRAAEKSNRLVADIPDKSDGIYVMTDQTRLRQVILNLLSNAIKFTSHGSVAVKLSEEAADGRTLLRLAVTDTGIGIDEEGQGRLFKPFSQVDASISRNYGGTGLGLIICKEIVESLGGRIGVRSAKGQGSTFWFEIPVDRADKSATAQAEAPVDFAGVIPRLNILLVEDNLVNQQVAAGFLRHLGQGVEVANDGAEAVEMISASRFDLVLMDMQMPRMDGIEATKVIRGMGNDIPIVAMTANASEDDRRLCAAAGMNGFQSKPVTKNQLARLISAFEVRPEATVAANVALDAVSVPVAALNDRQAEIVEALGEDAYNELLDAFFDDASQILADLAEAVLHERSNDIDRLLHTLKGAAGNLGFDSVAHTAQSLRETRASQSGMAAMAADIETQRTKRAA
ncbi:MULTISPECIES: ATP-binding protein [Rhizobium/Agrobacterium group]|uniref:ATP-binding protein n=1 Tax=Rhizobium/Agrobacterium group TaxID=227290 RepID=UPI001ADC4E36|nr:MULTISPECIES: ATP-binding protein [Rhizobium/Agrobacterium group]MBO9111767.1 response regulator [Agrobacterium sp. S2/73]QXZ76696.1 response regulator [Agrobacterium sp. S7/73]QYA17138.1 response regulator [Rhizobium sp. AB2/73]UEQ85289.1 response regulator [Rhizobium sp. AB2/73]